MKTAIMPDHSDFQKSRTALLTASVILIILNRVQFLTNSIDFFGLRIVVSKSEIFSLWYIIVCYLYYVFMIRVYAHASSREPDDLLLSNMRKDHAIRARILEEDLDPDEMKELEDQRLNLKRRALKTVESYFVDYAPAFIVSSFAIGRLAHKVIG